jgi:hypothetical protein
MKITAAQAEMACAAVRQSIATEQVGKPTPASRFDDALATDDISQLNSLLDDAWFGVPESTDCWGIEGFSEAVELLDSLPDEDEED